MGLHNTALSFSLFFLIIEFYTMQKCHTTENVTIINIVKITFTRPAYLIHELQKKQNSGALLVVKTIGNATMSLLCSLRWLPACALISLKALVLSIFPNLFSSTSQPELFDHSSCVFTCCPLLSPKQCMVTGLQQTNGTLHFYICHFTSIHPSCIKNTIFSVSTTPK